MRNLASTNHACHLKMDSVREAVSFRYPFRAPSYMQNHPAPARNSSLSSGSKGPWSLRLADKSHSSSHTHRTHCGSSIVTRPRPQICLWARAHSRVSFICLWWSSKELESKLLASLLIRPINTPHIIPPLRGLDYSADHHEICPTACLLFTHPLTPNLYPENFELHAMSSKPRKDTETIKLEAGIIEVCCRQGSINVQ